MALLVRTVVSKACARLGEEQSRVARKAPNEKEADGPINGVCERLKNVRRESLKVVMTVDG
jgi:hypothetical protein